MTVKRSAVTIGLVLASLLLGGLRIHGVKSEMFQGIAHIFVGGLFGSWIAGRGDLLPHLRIVPYLAVGLTVLEVACFVAGRISG